MHELFHVLTETLEEEASRYRSVISLFDIFHLQVIALFAVINSKEKIIILATSSVIILNYNFLFKQFFSFLKITYTLCNSLA